MNPQPWYRHAFPWLLVAGAIMISGIGGMVANAKNEADDAGPHPVHERLSFWASEVFEPRTARFTLQGRRILGEVAARARTIDLEVVIAVDYGELSAPRAAALKDFLVRAGIDERRVYSEAQKAGRERIEIEIIGSQ